MCVYVCECESKREFCNNNNNNRGTKLRTRGTTTVTCQKKNNNKRHNSKSITREQQHQRINSKNKSLGITLTATTRRTTTARDPAITSSPPQGALQYYNKIKCANLLFLNTNINYYNCKTHSAVSTSRL